MKRKRESTTYKDEKDELNGEVRVGTNG